MVKPYIARGATIAGSPYRSRRKIAGGIFGKGGMGDIYIVSRPLRLQEQSAPVAENSVAVLIKKAAVNKKAVLLAASPSTANSIRPGARFIAQKIAPGKMQTCDRCRRCRNRRRPFVGQRALCCFRTYRQ